MTKRTCFINRDSAAAPIRRLIESVGTGLSGLRESESLLGLERVVVLAKDHHEIAIGACFENIVERLR